jgi:hypothetical protein
MRKSTILLASISIALSSVAITANANGQVIPDFNINDKITIVSSGKAGVVLGSFCFANTGSPMGCIYDVYIKLPDLYQGQNNHRVLSGIMASDLHLPKPKLI